MYQHRLLLVLIHIILLITLAAAQTGPVAELLDPSGPAVATVSVVSENRGETVLEFRLSAVYAGRDSAVGQAWTTLAVPGMVNAAQSGWPEVPQLSAFVQISSASADVAIVEDDTLHRAYGAIRPAADPLDRDQSLELRRDPAPQFYTGHQTYPVHSVTVTLRGGIGRAQVALVTFSPFQTNAGTGECIIHTRMRVRVTHAGRAALDSDGRLPASTRDLLVRLLMTRGQESSEAGNPEQMLLITEPQFLPALQPFIAWKAQTGVLVHTAIYSHVASNGPALRTYIRGVCDTLRPTPGYLLIVGDVNVIPAFYGLNNSLTDHPYSLLSDDDYLPDISIGRIPCQTVDDCEVWVNRLLSYERDAVPERNFKGLVVSSNSGVDPQHGIYVGNLLRSSGMDTVDQLQEPQTTTLSNFLTSMNAGRQWIFYIGHGFAQGWSSIHPNFVNGNQEQVTSEAAPIVISVACATADLDYPGESFAEHWLPEPGGRGPVAYFGATERTPFYYSDTLGLGMLRAVFLQGCDRLGTAADLGRLATAQSFPQPSGGVTEETIQQFVLLGDPSMHVFSAIPESLTVNAPSTLPLHSTGLPVSVQRGSQLVAGAAICLMDDSARLYQVYHTDSLGQVSIPLQLTVPGTLHLTVTGHNAIPAMRAISIVSDTTAHLTLNAVRVMDATGDNDHQADRSESCALQFSFFNSGRAASPEGLVRVSCEDIRLILSSQALTLPSIASGQTVHAPESLRVAVSDSVNDQDVALLRVVTLPGNGDSSVTIYPLVLHAPRLVFGSASLQEDSGDGDGNPNAGERLALHLKFPNSGSDRAWSPACSIRTADPAVHILDVQLDSPSIAAGDTLVATAFLRADSTVPRGFEFTYGYELSAAHAAPVTGIGSARIGQIPVFLYELDPMPQPIDAVQDALSALGVEHERAQDLPPDLSRYMSIWIFCGVFPNVVSLPQAEAARIAQYLDSGGNCYWEGGDVWVFDEETPLHPYFHIRGMQDGSSDAGPVQGETGTAFAPYEFRYAGENSFIDRLAPLDNAVTILRNVRPGAVYPLCIAYAGATYRTVGSSIELGALADTTLPSTRVHLFRDILNWFGIPARMDTSAPTVRSFASASVYTVHAPVSISADVQDLSGVQSASLRYRIGDGMILTIPMHAVAGRYRTTLEEIPAGTTVYYSVRATNASPAHYTVTTPEIPLDIPPDSGGIFADDLSGTCAAELSSRITAGQGCSWSLTQYPQGIPVLELHSRDGESIAYTTQVFDASRLQNPAMSFWQYLRETSEQQRLLARVSGSTDGGQTFPHSVWAFTQQGGGALEEGVQPSAALSWMQGRQNVALRFEFFGNGYWRLRDIAVRSTAPSEAVPVKDLVIAVVPTGIQLAWSPVPGAGRYVVRGSVSTHFADGYKDLIITRDTTYAEWDDTLPTRYYEVQAILTESSTTISASRSAAELLPADLKWNRKLQTQARR
ncbi:MAG TPA: C25 family cysteine peptidase [bacterium]|jgi:hypothetical protein